MYITAPDLFFAVQFSGCGTTPSAGNFCRDYYRPGLTAGRDGGEGGEGLFVLQSRAETVWSRRPRASVFKPGASALEHVVDRFVGEARDAASGSGSGQS